MNASLIRRTPTIADSYGPVLTLEELLGVLKMSRTTAKRRMQAGTFPIPALPRRAGTTEPYRFAAIQIDRYLARAMDGAR